MQTIDVAAVILFFVVIVLAVWKGDAFLQLKPVWRVVVAMTVGSVLLAWIVVRHVIS